MITISQNISELVVVLGPTALIVVAPTEYDNPSVTLITCSEQSMFGLIITENDLFSDNS